MDILGIGGWIGEIFTNLYYAFLGIIRVTTWEYLALFKKISTALANGVMRVEDFIIAYGSSALSKELISEVFQYIYGVAVTLVVLKLLWKGLQVYILWRDGDADNSPQTMIIGACMAIIACIAFPTLYNIAAYVTSDITAGVIEVIDSHWLHGDSAFDSIYTVDEDEVFRDAQRIFDRALEKADTDGDGVVSLAEAEVYAGDPAFTGYDSLVSYFPQQFTAADQAEWPQILCDIFADRDGSIEAIYSVRMEWAEEDAVEEMGVFDYYVAVGKSMGASPITVLLATVIYTVLYGILILKLIGRGVEMLFLRWGFPFAAVGLVNSDGGIFSSYMQLIFKQIATSIIQLVAMHLSYYVILDFSVANIMLGIAIAIVAFRTPNLMAQLLAPPKQGSGRAVMALSLLARL